MSSPSEQMRIRQAQPGDEQEIFRLINELAQFEHLEHQVEGSPAQLARDLFGDRPVAECLVVEQGDGLIGYALFFSTYSTFLTRAGIWLEDLFVTESKRGQGIGRALLIAVAQAAKKRGSGRMEWSVLDWNERAISFYRSLSADVLPDWRICRLGRDTIEVVSSLS